VEFFPYLGIMPLPTTAPISISNYTGTYVPNWISNLILFNGPSYPITCTLISTSLTSNVVTVITSNQTFIVGTQIAFPATLAQGALDNQILTILTNTGNVITAAFTHANWNTTAETAQTLNNYPYLQMVVDGSAPYPPPFSLTLPNPVRAGSTIIAAVLYGDWNAHFTTSSVSDGVNSYTILDGPGTTLSGFGSTKAFVNVYYAFNSVAGSRTVTVNASSFNYASGVDFVVFEFPGDLEPTVAANPVSEFLQATNFTQNLAPTAVVTGMAVQINGSEAFSSLSAAILDISITGGLLSVTCLGADVFAAGETVLLNGLTTATFLNGQTVTLLDPIVLPPSFVFTALFAHADYATAADTGIATTIGNVTAADYLEISLINPAADSVPFTFQLPTTVGMATVGGATNTWGLGQLLTSALLNDPSFGFNIQAFAADGQAVQFNISGVTLIPYATPAPPQNITYMKTYAQDDGEISNLFLDAAGTLWSEDPINQPFVLTNIFTAIEPNTFGQSVTADDREFIALSDLKQGTDMPRSVTSGNGSNIIDRVSQVGPGAGPVCSVSTAGNSILTITQVPAVVLSGNWIVVGSSPGDYGHAGSVPGNLMTIFDVPSPPTNIVVGTNIVISGFPIINGFNFNNGVGTNPAYYTVASVGGSTYWISFVVPYVTWYNQQISGTVQSTEATLTAAAQIPNIAVGGQIAIGGTSVAGYDNTWNIDTTPNSSQMTVTNTSLTANLATYAFSLISGTAPAAGEFVTVTGTTNANGIFNVANAVISAVTGSTFSLGLSNATNVPGAAETGTAIVFGNIITFDALAIYGNSTGGTITTAGLIGAGQRVGVVSFLTRNGYLTKPSPKTTFQVPVGASAITVSIPTGPANVVARVVSFTGANGGQFFYIPNPVTVINNGVTTVETATVVNDNVSTSATFNFSDATLLSATAIDITGNNLFALQELGSAAYVMNFAERLLWFKVQNKINPNLLNYSFDGGRGVITSAQFTGGGVGTNITYPLGWTVDQTYGQGSTVVNSPVFGDAFYIQNTSGSTKAIWGMITQPASIDENGVPIIAANTQYSVRVTASTPSSQTAGNLVVDLYRPSTQTILGSFTISLASMTDDMAIFTGSLLTVPIGPSPGAPPPPPPPVPGPPVYIAALIQSVTGTVGTLVEGEGVWTPITMTFPSPVTAGNTMIMELGAFDYNSPPTITDNLGNTWNIVNTASAGGSQYLSYICYAANARAGVTTITVSNTNPRVWHGQVNGSMQAVVGEFSGLTTPVRVDGQGAHGNNGPISPFTSGAITTSNAHDLIVSGFLGAVSSAPPTGFTLVGQTTIGAASLAFEAVSSAGSYNPSWPASGFSGNTVAFPIAVSNPPVPSSNAVAVPVDLLFRVYATNLLNGGDVMSDRIEIFPTLEPNIVTSVICSYNGLLNSVEAYDAVTGYLGLAGENPQPVVCGFNLWDTAYIVKTHSLLETTDNGQEPGDDPGWTNRLVSSEVGTTSINGVDSGEDWAIILGQPGLFAFNGGQPVRITSDIQQLWGQINWAYGHTCIVKNDIVNQRVMCFVPMKTPNPWFPTGLIPDNANPTVPNVCLMFSYKQLNTITDLIERGAISSSAYTGKLLSHEFARKWSIWTIQAASAAFLTRSDTTQPLFLGNAVGNSKIYSLQELSYNDDGLSIPQIYTTYGWPTQDQAQMLELNYGRYKFEGMTSLLEGEGQLNVTVYPDSLDSPYAHQLLPNIALTTPMPAGDTEIPINEVGNRLFVQFSTNAVGAGFTVQNMVMILREHPWSPKRGSN
jgi:hypothetical protein